MINLHAVSEIISDISNSKYKDIIENIIIRPIDGNCADLIINMVDEENNYRNIIIHNKISDGIDSDHLFIDCNTLLKKISIPNNCITRMEYHSECKIQDQFKDNIVALIPTKIDLPSVVNLVTIFVSEGVIKLCINPGFNKDLEGEIEFIQVKYDNAIYHEKKEDKDNG